jgi:uncharacterized membrane protein
MAARTHEVTRLEGFSDAVFGFALTLLVVSLDTPEKVGDLLDLAQGFLPFALTFAMVGWIWHEHNFFFRRYGLQDAWTVFLNLVLLFVVLFYVYPLKFLAGQVVTLATGAPYDFGQNLTEARWLMVIYSLGVVLIFSIFGLLYRHAWRCRGALGLTRRDETRLIHGQRSHLISAGLGVLSVAIVTINPGWAAAAGFIYVLMGPLHAWNGYREGAALARIDHDGTA